MWCNQMGTVFADMSSWTTLKKHLGTQFYELLIVMCCISLNMHFLQSISKFKIFKIKIPDILFAYVVVILICHFRAIKDEISVKTVPIWLHHTVDENVTIFYGYKIFLWSFVDFCRYYITFDIHCSVHILHDGCVNFENIVNKINFFHD